jgi:hypothetical protein
MRCANPRCYGYAMRGRRFCRVHDVDDPENMICTVPDHQHHHDHLGACDVCGVPTVAGLHPNARTTLLAKRPDLAHLAP